MLSYHEQWNKGNEWSKCMTIIPLKSKDHICHSKNEQLNDVVKEDWSCLQKSKKKKRGGAAGPQVSKVPLPWSPLQNSWTVLFLSGPIYFSQWITSARNGHSAIRKMKTGQIKQHSVFKLSTAEPFFPHSLLKSYAGNGQGEQRVTRIVVWKRGGVFL